MKKILSVALAFVMVLSLSVCAFAADATFSNQDPLPEGATQWGEENKSTQDVTLTVEDGTKSATVYKVVVEWDALSFTYTEAAEGTWNPESHSYDNAGATGTWSAAKSVKVTNHSNATLKVTATATTKEEASNDSLAVKVDGNDTCEKNLTTAVGTEVASAPSVSFSISVTGTPAADYSNAVIGNIAIVITDPNAGI